MSTLYVVATPIGNLNDLSPRAVETLRAVSLIVAEDTRVTMKLLNAFEIRTPLISSHRHSEEGKAGSILERMKREGIDAALVTDAGTPGISDPGWALVERCRAEGISVAAVPGPCAAAAAVSVSGFEVTEFAFYGFLPREKKALGEKLISIADAGLCAVIYESPYRIKDLIAVIAAILPGARLCLCAEMTKRFERSYWGSPVEVLALLKADANSEKGEYCLVMDVSGVELPRKESADASPEAMIFELLMKGDTLPDARRRIADLVGKNRAYAASLAVGRYLEDYARSCEDPDE